MPANAGPTEVLSRLRPRSPGRLALIGVGLVVVGWLIPFLEVLATLGVLALIIAGVTALMRPRPRMTYWRGRRIDLSDSSSLSERVYRAIYG